VVVQIQEALGNIFLEQKDIIKEIIFLEEMNEVEFNTAPWISILPDKASIDPAWHWDNAYTTKDTLIKVQRKYTITQPITVRIVFENKAELDKIVNTFLQDLPKSFVINNSNIELNPREIEYILAKGELGVSVAIIGIDTIYPIHNIMESAKKIKQISFDMNKK